VLENLSEDDDHDFGSSDSQSETNEIDTQEPYKTFSEKYVQQQLVPYERLDPALTSQKQILISGKYFFLYKLSAFNNF